MKSSQLGACLAAVCLLAGCYAAQKPGGGVVALPPPLVAGVGEEIVEGHARVPCASLEVGRDTAITAAESNALARAATAYGDGSAGERAFDLIRDRHVQRVFEEGGVCYATVQVLVRTEELKDRLRKANRAVLAAVGRPVVAMAIQSYRILPLHEATTRRGAAELIDSLQEELVLRGFDVRRSLRARKGALGGGGNEVVDISSLERDKIASLALRDGVAFLIQGEVKVTDNGRRGQAYEAVADGSLEVVELATDRIIAGFRDAVVARHDAASAAYTKAMSAFARSAAEHIAPQMLDSWIHSKRRNQ